MAFAKKVGWKLYTVWLSKPDREKLRALRRPLGKTSGSEVIRQLIEDAHGRERKTR